MKAKFESLSILDHHTILIREFDQVAFSAPFHFHPEIELTLINSGYGERYVGSHMNRFETGDLILIGSDVPHCWKLNPGSEAGSCVVVQFSPEFMGEKFFQHPAMSQIGHLLDQCKSGIKLTGKLHDKIEIMMQRMMELSKPFDLYINLLELLEQIATSKEWHLLTTTQRINSMRNSDQDRIWRVMNYIQQHFREAIKLAEVAAEAHMTPQAFCKFFKRSTRQTLTEVVTGYRLDYATTLLTGTDLNIAEVAYQSGFGDLSYFFKVFKKHKNTTPAEYRSRFIS